MTDPAAIKRPRRIRIGTCPECGHVFPFQYNRREHPDDIQIQICTACYLPEEQAKIQSQLIDRSD